MGYGVDAVVARHEGTAILSRPGQELLVVGALTEYVYGPYDIPVPRPESLDDLLADVVVCKEGEAGHYRRDCRWPSPSKSLISLSG